MDPTACLYEILSELAETNPDRERVREHVEELHYWLDRGGFLPKVVDVGDPANPLFMVQR